MDACPAALEFVAHLYHVYTYWLKCVCSAAQNYGVIREGEETDDEKQVVNPAAEVDSAST